MSEEKKKLSPEELEQVAGGIAVARWYYTVVTNDKLYAVLLNDKGEAIQRVSGAAPRPSPPGTERAAPCLVSPVRCGMCS